MKGYRSNAFHGALSAEDWFMCLICGKQRNSDTCTEFMGSGVTELWVGLRKQIHTYMERGGRGGEG